MNQVVLRPIEREPKDFFDGRPVGIAAYLSGISVKTPGDSREIARVAEFSAVSLKGIQKDTPLGDVSFACRHAQSFLLREPQ